MKRILREALEFRTVQTDTMVNVQVTERYENRYEKNIFRFG